MITYYKYDGALSDHWQFDSTSLGRINLLVGASGSGKTRFLNTLFNFAQTIANGKPFSTGNWELKIEVDTFEYRWKYEGIKESETNREYIRESLTRFSYSGKKELLVERTDVYFRFKDEILPKIDPTIPSVNLLREEDTIAPLFKVFSHVQRRNFQHSALQDAVTVQNIPKATIENFKKKPALEDLWIQKLYLGAKLFLLKEFFEEKYKLVIGSFQDVFPTIKKVDIKFLPESPTQGVVPFFLVQEKGVEDWIPLQELSSGMQKVLLIVTDILSLPGESVYIIDEYENSLGVNAIDFLPDFLIEYGGTNQFFITTHHPYLINNMPMKNWLVLNRKGSRVRIKRGCELEKQFGKSRQQAFIQLINDSFYSEIAA